MRHLRICTGLIVYDKTNLYSWIFILFLGGAQPQWQNRYPPPGPGSYGPPPGERTWTPPGSSSGPPRGTGPQWSNDRTSYYGPSGSPDPWNKMQMRPPYRPDMRGPGPMPGPQRPVRLLFGRFLSSLPRFHSCFSQQLHF